MKNLITLTLVLFAISCSKNETSKSPNTSDNKPVVTNNDTGNHDKKYPPSPPPVPVVTEEKKPVDAHEPVCDIDEEICEIPYLPTSDFVYPLPQIAPVAHTPKCLAGEVLVGDACEETILELDLHVEILEFFDLKREVDLRKSYDLAPTVVTRVFTTKTGKVVDFFVTPFEDNIVTLDAFGNFFKSKNRFKKKPLIVEIWGKSFFPYEKHDEFREECLGLAKIFNTHPEWDMAKKVVIKPRLATHICN